MPADSPPSYEASESTFKTLIPLSPSSSSASLKSLTSDEEPFDHLAEPPPSSLPTIRDLVSRSSTSPTTPTQLPVSTQSGIQLLRAVGSEQLPFARDVFIRGWKIVGGKSFGEAKVGAYAVYDVEITLRNGGTISVLRRYTDFVNLRNSLKTRFPHLKKTIPALPGKAHMSKFSTSFLENRQPRLQRFLKTVVLHPEMGVGGNKSVIGEWVVGQGG